MERGLRIFVECRALSGQVGFRGSRRGVESCCRGSVICDAEAIDIEKAIASRNLVFGGEIVRVVGQEFGQIM